MSRTLDRRETARGELVLREVDGAYEVISNGVFLMDTRAGGSERLLATAALGGRTAPCRVLVGGLGVGFTLAAALAHPACGPVTVVEVEPAVVEWQERYLGALAGHPLTDPRVDVVCANLIGWLADGRSAYDVVLLDIDNGPHWTVTPDNRRLYDDGGLALVASRLAAGGTVAVWSAAADPEFAARLGARFGGLREHRVPVARGEPDVVYLAGGAPPGVPGGPVSSKPSANAASRSCLE